MANFCCISIRLEKRSTGELEKLFVGCAFSCPAQQQRVMNCFAAFVRFPLSTIVTPQKPVFETFARFTVKTSHSVAANQRGRMQWLRQVPWKENLGFQAESCLG